MTDEEKEMIYTIRKRQRKWIRHTLKYHSLLRMVIEKTVRERKDVG